jgi:transcription antitermination factor NusG
MSGDQRDKRTWVVVELSRMGELKLEEGSIETLLRDTFKIPVEVSFFIPSTSYESAGKKILVHLMEGYLFIAYQMSDSFYISLENTIYIRKILTSKLPNGTRIIHTIPESKISGMREKLASKIAEDILPGMSVRVVDGPFTNLEGVVESVDADLAQVYFTMRSIEMVAPVARSFLVPQEEV